MQATAMTELSRLYIKGVAIIKVVANSNAIEQTIFISLALSLKMAYFSLLGKTTWEKSTKKFKKFNILNSLTQKTKKGLSSQPSSPPP